MTMELKSIGEEGKFAINITCGGWYDSMGMGASPYSRYMTLYAL